MKTNRFFGILLILAILIGIFTMPVMAEDAIKVLLNGKELEFDVSPQIIGDRTMVPMRKIFEELGAKVEWEEETRTITATAEDSVIIMQIDNVVISVNGEEIVLDVPPQLVEDRTLVPVRAVAESLDAIVEWDEDMRTVTITKEEQQPSQTEKRELAEGEFSLIDDRLFVTMPEGTVDIARQESIMSAPASNHEETELVLEEGKGEITLHAYELFMYSSGKLENDAKVLTDKWSKSSGRSYTYSKMSSANIEAMYIIPAEFNTNLDYILLRRALVKTADNTLIVVSVYANPQKFTDKSACFKLADEILATLEEGTRIIDTSAHKEKIGGCEIALQKEYVFTLSIGPDFVVYYITKIVKVGEKQPNMGIYIGGHPDGVSLSPDAEVKMISDKILGKHIEWISYKTNDVLHMETIFELDSDYWKMHIFMSGHSEKDIEEMQNMARSLKE